MKTPTLLAVVLLAGTAAHAVATGPSPPACADTPYAKWPLALMEHMQYSITDFGAGACSEAVRVLGKGGWMGRPRIACDTDLTAGLGKVDPSGGMIGFDAWLQRNDNIPPGRKGLQRRLKMTGTLADLCPATCNACPAGDNHGPCPTALKAKFGCDPDDLECVCENSGGILGWVWHEAPAGTCAALKVVTAGSWNAMCAGPDEDCPMACQNCKSGGGSGGKAVNKDGDCEFHCSTGGYCGATPAYVRGGTDCTRCGKWTAAPTPAPTVEPKGGVVFGAGAGAASDATPSAASDAKVAGTAAHAVATGPSPPACADTPFAQWPVALMTNMQYSITDFGAGACSEAVKVLGKGGWMGLPRIACDTDLTAGLGKADPSGGMIGFGAWLQRNDNIPPGRKGLQRMLKMTGTLADLCPATCNACPAGDNHGPCPTALKAKFGCDPDDLECVCENSGGILGWVRHEAPAGTCTALNVVTAGSWNAMCADKIDTIPSPTSFTLTDAKGRTKGEVVFGAGAGAASDAKVPADLTPKEKLVPVTKRAWFAPVVAVAAVAVVVALAAAFVRWGAHGATAQAAEGNTPAADLDDAAEWGAPVHNKGNKAPGAPIVVIANVV